MERLLQPEIWIAFLTLASLEIVLGIDNIVFITILADRLPRAQQPRARTLGLGLAMLTRIALLFSIAWLIGLTQPLFVVLGQAISLRDVILGAGGLFLLAKSTTEIHAKLEELEHGRTTRAAGSLGGVVVQIGLMDIIFSLDSVITAVGMAKELWVMVAAIIAAVVVMMAAAGGLSRFVNQHPTLKVLALSFLLLIGLSLLLQGFHFEIPKGYIYFAMGFSLFVELMNMRVRAHEAVPVQLRGPQLENPSAKGPPSLGRRSARPGPRIPRRSDR